MNTKLRITELDHLPEEKRTELNNWIADLGYRAAMEKVRTEWSFEITYNKIYRYYHRVLDKKVLDPENKLTMPEFIAYQNGEPTRHHELTHLNVQKRACELSQLPDNSASMLVTLMRIANNPIQLQLNQRRLALAEQTAALKREELDWKKSIDPSSQSQRKSKIFNQNSSIDSAPLGGLTVAQFIQSVPPKPVAARRETAADISPSDADTPPARSITGPDSGSTNQTGPRTSSSAAPTNVDNVPSAQQPTDNVSICNHANSSNDARRLDHMRRRASSFLKPDPNNPVPRDDSWRLECPCGEPHPCPNHEPLPDWANDISPWCADFFEQLEKRGIPYTYPP